MKKERETLKGRRRSFIAVITAIIMAFNMLPMSAFATVRTQRNEEITATEELLLSAGDSLSFTYQTGGYHIIYDGDTANQIDVTDSYTIPISGGRYLAKLEGEDKVHLTTVYEVVFETRIWDDSRNSNILIKKQVKRGEKVTPPTENVVLPGHIVTGWNIAGTEEPFDFDTPITSDQWLYVTDAYDQNAERESGIDIRDEFRGTADLENNGITTKEEACDAMYKAVAEELTGESDVDEASLIIGSKFYELTLEVSFDGGVTWEIVSPDNFPADGIWVDLDYPEGTDARTNNFMVAHMFSHNMNGHRAGEVETIVPEKAESGLRFKVTSLSPVLVTWSLAASGISIEPKEVTLKNAGETAQLTSNVTPLGALDKSVTWTSDNTNVATVDATGKVTAVAEGTCTITATTNDGGFTDTAKVTVKFEQVVTEETTESTTEDTTEDTTEEAPVVVTEPAPRAPKTGENSFAIYAMIFCLMGGIVTVGYSAYARRKK